MVDHNIGLDSHYERQCLKYNFAIATSSSGEEGGSSKEQDRLLPIANVGRIMKQILPPNAKISKESKETMQECVSEFISFVTGEASDRCHKEKRKTVNGDDVCWAFETLGFDDYTKSMKRYLNRYRELEGERANQNKNNNNINNYEDNQNDDEEQRYGGESNRSRSSTNYLQLDENRNSFIPRT